MIEAERGKTMTVSLDERAASALAQLCKRTIVERVKPFAANEAEACEMTEALERLGAALSDQGFAPR
jgi:hypothetical protein